MAITAHENMSMIAVGFKDGTVLLIRGNIARDRQSRLKVVHTEKEPGVYVTGQTQEPLFSGPSIQWTITLTLSSFGINFMLMYALL